MARYTAATRTLEAVIREGTDPKVAAKEVAKFHRRGVAEVEADYRTKLGAVPPSEDIVDGRKFAPLESVKLDGGVIVTKWSMMGDLLEYMDALLIMHSPHGPTGRYAKGHRLFADGVEVDDINNPPPAKEYVFINTVPYARKIEGMGKRPPQSKQAPGGVYEGVAALASGRYGNLAWIKFVFRSVTEQYSDVALGGRKGGKKATAEQRAAYNAHNDNRFPAIRIYWK